MSAVFSKDAFLSELQDGLAQLGIGDSLIDDAAMELLFRYVKELTLWNDKMNLVGRLESDFISRHLLDSLAPLSILADLKPESAADIGSGAGLPGMLLAICMPGTRWTLVERSGKKAGFLRSTIAMLGLGGRVEVADLPVEEVKQQFDLVVFRAFRQFEDFFDPIRNRVAPGGTFAAYKGKLDIIEKELAGVGLTPGDVVLDRLEVPGLAEERWLLRYRP